jgi:monovalent cation:proton antiporter-2 (CPA2) family protein
MLELTAIFLAAAVFSVPLFKRLGLGSVLGYLAAGAVIGPSGMGLVGEVESTLHFAEFGVVLLLFIIGLELEPKRLIRMQRAVFGLGGAQVLVTSLALGGIAMAFGLPIETAGVVGVALAMSSTAFATQILAEKNEMAAPHGRSAFGILLFQDFAAIPVLALVPLLGEGAHDSETSGVVRFLIAIGVIVGLVVGGRLLLRPAFGIIARARSHELSVASALLVVIGTSLIMEQVELSAALGAFIAGVLLADSEYRHELEANIEPFKGLLLGLFFMAVGMSANLRLLVSEPLIIVGIALGLVALKMAVLALLGRFAGLDRWGQASLAIAISQGGEFAFVIFGAALEVNVVPRELVERLVVAVTVSMMLTPLLFIVRDRVKARLVTRPSGRDFDAIDDEGSQVIIAGFGRFGQIVSRVLHLRGIPFTALDASPEHVDFVRKFGNRIYYGDASRVDLLRAAKVAHARVFVLAIDDFEASMRTLEVVQKHFPHVRIIARARNRQHAYALLGAGVETVIRETFAGSVDAARATLVELGLTTSDARETVQKFAEYDERMVRETFVHRDDQDKLIASAKEYSAELQRIFDADDRS